MTAYLDILMFAALCGGILLGYPVTFTLAGTAFLFALLGASLGVFDLSLLGALAQRVYGILTNEVLVAIPVFVFMGVVLEKSRIADDLLQTMGRLFGGLRGGLGVAVIVVGALLAASTGIVGATVVAMGLIALPSMLRNGYDPKLAAGVVCTAGTLGQIIPPSTLLIILADVMSNAYQQAQYAQGKFSVETLSVGQIFAAALLPGLTLVVIYMGYMLGRAWLQPACAPALMDVGERPPLREVMRALVPPILLMIAVLGSILGGIATPTEAASVGAVGALLLGGARLVPGRSSRLLVGGGVALAGLVLVASIWPVRLQRSDAAAGDWLVGALAVALVVVGIAALAQAVWRAHSADVLKPVLTQTMTVSAMIFGTIIAASIFSLVFRGLGGDHLVETLIASMPGGETGALLFVMLLVFLLGFFLDFVEISVILLPLVVPALIVMGFDPIWLAVLIAINLQTSFLTPPFGFSLFYLRGAAPKSITTWQIYAGVVPFIGLQALGIVVVWSLPGIATWVPRLLFG